MATYKFGPDVMAIADLIGNLTKACECVIIVTYVRMYS